jgi:hypothetical protein
MDGDPMDGRADGPNDPDDRAGDARARGGRPSDGGGSAAGSRADDVERVAGTLADDPIFQGKEREPTPTKRTTLLFQFFLFPLLIVAASVGVFLFFGAIGGSPKSLPEFLVDVRTGGENVQKQAAQQIAAILRDERRRVDRKEIPLAKAEYVQGTFRADLRAAFEEAFEERTRKSVDRQIFLATALGLVGDPEALPALAAKAAPTTQVDVRRAVAFAISLLDTAEVVPVLVRLVGDDDERVRSHAITGLSRHHVASLGAAGAPAIAALKGALSDPSEYVRTSAALALSLEGDVAGLELSARLLDPAVARELSGRRVPGFEVESPDPTAVADMGLVMIAAGLKAVDALRAAHRDPADPATAAVAALRPKVEGLATDGPAPEIRRLSQRVLDRWGPPK